MSHGTEGQGAARLQEEPEPGFWKPLSHAGSSPLRAFLTAPLCMSALFLSLLADLLPLLLAQGHNIASSSQVGRLEEMGGNP